MIDIRLQRLCVPFFVVQFPKNVSVVCEHFDSRGNVRRYVVDVDKKQPGGYGVLVLLQ